MQLALTFIASFFVLTALANAEKCGINKSDRCIMQNQVPKAGVMCRFDDLQGGYQLPKSQIDDAIWKAINTGLDQAFKNERNYLHGFQNIDNTGEPIIPNLPAACQSTWDKREQLWEYPIFINAPSGKPGPLRLVFSYLADYVDENQVTNRVFAYCGVLNHPRWHKPMPGYYVCD